jgi:undecaprenyl phosphate N,N'-diacetylbacillosamine 1-phosphate transferase
MLYKKYIKRLLDIVISFFGLLLISPLCLIVIIFLMVANKGSVFYFQDRPGLNTKIFKLFKFKTMNDRRDSSGKLLPDVQRITYIGQLMRFFSIDELPQLINVLIGDMSLIGPRPLLVKYLPLYTETQSRRHIVRPGMTGLAQISGRNALSWEKKFELDVWYVDHVSFLLDCEILFKTIIKVIKKEGINNGKDETMRPFTGNVQQTKV